METWNFIESKLHRFGELAEFYGDIRLVEPSSRIAIFGTCDWGRVFVCDFFGYGGPSDENFGAWCWWSFTKSWSQLVFFGGILLLPSRESYQQNIPSRNRSHIPPNGKRKISTQNCDGICWFPGGYKVGPQPGYNSSYQLIFRLLKKRGPEAPFITGFWGPSCFPMGGNGDSS